MSVKLVSPTMREKHRLMLFNNRVLKKILDLGGTR
jgi:hypothetical protein